MEIGNSGKISVHRKKRTRVSIFLFPVALFSVCVLGGCGAPGEPHPPEPPVPVDITDLSANQEGDGVALIFTPPQETTGGLRLPGKPAVEIFRAPAGPGGSADAKSFRLVYTIPGTLLETYQQNNRVRFLDPLRPGDVREHPGDWLAYRVRTRVSKKRASADSNTVRVRVFPVPERIGAPEARVSEPAIELSWSEPQRTSGGAPLSGVSGYRVYRGELEPGTAEAAQKDLPQASWKKPLALFAPSPTNRYRDTEFEFGTTYVYVVRSVISAEGNAIESGDSARAVVTPKDVFPPAAPQGVVAIFVAPGMPPSPRVELSWSMNVETDLAGYRVYRSEEEGTQGRLMTPDLLPAPAYRDMSVGAGRRYGYTVTAVDRAGNESAGSAPAAVEVPQQQAE